MINSLLRFWILLVLWHLTAYGHGYLFSESNEEMRDNILIEINQEFMLIQYESVYLGQIAPHIRLMIDSDSDGILTRDEIDRFFILY